MSKGDKESCVEVLSYEAIQTITKIHNSSSIKNTCYDYIDAFLYDYSGKCGIRVFVEPCGNLTKWGDSFEEVADWWADVFFFQPKDLGYCFAGNNLGDNWDKIKSKKAEDVWDAIK